MFSLFPLLAQAANPAVTPSAPITQPTTQPVDQLTQLVQRLGLEITWNETPGSAWFALLAAIFLGLLAGKITSTVLRNTAVRVEKRNAFALGTILRSAATPTSILLITFGMSVGLTPIAMTDGGRLFLGRILQLLYVVSIGWFLFNLVDLVDLWLRNIASKTTNHLDDQLAPLIRKTLRIFLVVIVGLYIAQNVFKQEVTTWLAGLGIAGLAISLAAQDSIKNLFGSITVILDHPFFVGERIVFDGFDGTVEEIGFRSTRVRLTNGELATIPNSKFIDGSVRNISRRPSFPKTIELPLSPDMTPDQVRKALAVLKGVIQEPGLRDPFDWEKSPPRVFFDELRADVRVLKVSYAYPSGDWWAYVDHLERLQLRILEALSAAGILFAANKMTLTTDSDAPIHVKSLNA